jgi:SNF2 family DNA or RNA helicase
MSSGAIDLQFHVTSKLNKKGTMQTKKCVIGQDLKYLFLSQVPLDDNEWVQIHSDKFIKKDEHTFLHHLLETQKLDECPLKLFISNEFIKSQKTDCSSDYGEATYYIDCNCQITTYKLYISFDDGLEYMVSLDEDNIYFMLLNYPELHDKYRIHVMQTGKYIFYISKKYISDVVNNELDIDIVLKSLIKHHQIQGNPNFHILNDKNIPCALSFPITNGLILDDKYMTCLKESLLPHQVDNINWMAYLEKLVSLKMTRLDYVNTLGMIEFKISNGHYYTKHSYQKIYNKTSLINTPLNESIYLRGGILADEAGMGKTRSMLGLVLADIIYPTSVSIDKEYLMNNIEFYKIDELDTQNKVTLMDNEITLKHYNELIGTKIYKLSNTLVVAPIRVIDIWQEEIFEITHKDIKYVIVSNMTHVKKITVNQIIESDIVILSSKLLDNKRYLEHIKKYPDSNFQKYLWHRLVIDEAHEVMKIDTTQYPVDIKTQQIQNYIMGVNSFTKWCVSGTPLVNREINMGGYIRFLGEFMAKDAIYNLDIDDIKKLIRCYFRRHDKRKMIDALPMPTVKEEIVYLKQSSIEKAIYRSAMRKYNKLRLMQLCTHVQISEEEKCILGNFAGHKIMSLVDIEASMLEHYKTKIAQIENETNNLTTATEIDKQFRKKILHKINVHLSGSNKQISLEKMANTLAHSSKVQYVSTLVDDYLNDYMYQKIWEYIGQLSSDELWTVMHVNQEIDIKHDEKLASKTKDNYDEIKTLTNQMGLFKQSYISESVKEPCCICYEQFDKIIITKCRHIFCGNCMKTLFQSKQYINCPLCRNQISNEDINVTDIKLIEKSINHGVQEEDIKKYGTKLAFLIKKLRDLLDGNSLNRVVIFSQWTLMLSIISNVLVEFKIPHLLCKGNPNVVKSTMQKFAETEESQVLLLTPESCIIGNDLSKATHIIMTDVLMMDKIDANALENQLLGYVQRIGQNKEITVIKLITLGTIEEEYHRLQK